MKYTFSHRAGDRYYWKRRAQEYGPGYEEIVSCNVAWFWSERPVSGPRGRRTPSHVAGVTGTAQVAPDQGEVGPLDHGHDVVGGLARADATGQPELTARLLSDDLVAELAPGPSLSRVDLLDAVDHHATGHDSLHLSPVSIHRW